MKHVASRRVNNFLNTMFSFSRPGVYLLATSIKRFNCNIISSHLGLLNSYVKSVHSSAITWCQDDDKNKAQKDKLGGKILLLDSSDTQIGMMTYVEAQRLAMKKNLKLVKLEDPTKRYKQDVYQLLTGLQLHNERMKQRHLKNEMLQAKQFKGDKTIIIRAKITSHDLGIKLKTIQKWITQGFYVRITIHNDLSESAVSPLT